MTNEERDLIIRFIERVGGAQASGFATAGAPGAGPPLPPVDREADALIGDLFNRYPEARYRVTQMAFVQEHALAAAQNRIQQLEWEAQQARQAQPGPQPGAPSPWGQPPQPQQPASRGFFGSLFGGGSRQPPPSAQYAPPQYAPPPPQYAPGYSPGMFQQRGGSGFLGSALTTAAGVAGGLVAGNALMGLFSGHGGSASAATGTGFTPATPASPWAAPAPAVGAPTDSYDVGGADKGAANTDQGGWQQTATDQGGWQQTSTDQGGWQQASTDQGGWSAPAPDTNTADSGGWSDPGTNVADSGSGGGDDWT